MPQPLDSQQPNQPAAPLNSANDPSADTGDGFLVGVEPAKPRMQDAYTQTATGQPQTGQVSPESVSPDQPAPVPTTPPPGFFTREDLEKARQEEKSKLYGRIETVEQQLQAQREREEQEAHARQEEAERLQAEARAKEEEEMETRQLLERREQEWNQRFTELQSTYEQDRAVFEKERQLVEIERYRQERLEQEAEFIMPELRDLISTSSLEAVDASIEEMKQRTEAIMGNFDSPAASSTFQGSIANRSPGRPNGANAAERADYGRRRPIDGHGDLQATP